MIGVAGRDDLDSVLGFIEERDVGAFPHIVDESGDIWAGFDVRSQPSFVFVNDDGSVSPPTRSLTQSEIEDRLDELVNT